MTNWLKANKLSINVSKTHYMVFHRSRRKLDKEDILLDNTIIKQVAFTKFLGIIIGDKNSSRGVVASATDLERAG